MTSTNDGKDVKSIQSSGSKAKTHYVDLYKSLDNQLKNETAVPERTKTLCEAWRSIHGLCKQSAPTTYQYLLQWIQKQTAKLILQTAWWKSPENKHCHALLIQAIEACVDEIRLATSKRNGVALPWENLLAHRADWFKANLADPWGHPVLRVLLDPQGTTPTDDEVLDWLRKERGTVFVIRLRELAASKCDDLALALASSVMDRVRASITIRSDAEQCAEAQTKPKADKEKSIRHSGFASKLRSEAGFQIHLWEMLVDIEFVLLHKRDKRSRCIDLAKQIPFHDGLDVVERLENHFKAAAREKKKMAKLWKNAKEVAALIAQVLIARCMVISTCVDLCYNVLNACARALVRLLPPNKLPSAANALAAPAVTAKHLHTFAAAVAAQSKDEMKPFVCELYVRAITAGMNELERLKLKTEKEVDARSMEQTLASWFVDLGALLRASDRFNCECILTAFSVHPSPNMYGRIESAPILPPVNVDRQEVREESTSEFGSWASDSRSQTNLVKTSETLNMKQTQHQSNVLSTAILNEGEALGLNPDLCQDIAVLLSGPRVKTLSWDMDRDLLLENCMNYMERTDGGTRALTTELKYLNLDPSEFQHLPEEEEDENDKFYGIEKGYEHLVDVESPDAWTEEIIDNERTDTALSASDDSIPRVVRVKKKSKKILETFTDESDFFHLSTTFTEQKERPHSKERRKHRDKDTIDPLSLDGNKEKILKQKREKKEKKAKKTDKDKPRTETSKIKVLPGFNTASITDSDYDSQGKSSLHSNFEGNENIVYDGLFNIDEMMTSHVQDKLVKTEYKKASDTTVSGHTDTMINTKTVTYPVNNIADATKPTLKTMSEEVKRSLTRFISERSKVNVSKPVAPIHNVERRMPLAIPRSTVSLPAQISPKVIAIPEMDIPKSYIERKIENNVTSQRAIDVNHILYNDSAPRSSSPNATSNYLVIDKIERKPLTGREIFVEKQMPKVMHETSCQNNYRDFINQWRESMNATPEPYRRRNKEIPSTSNFKSESLQGAKLISQKDKSLNTFSRLSYMHKNKMDKKQRNEFNTQNYLRPDPFANQSFDQLLAEHRQCKSSYLYTSLKEPNYPKANTNVRRNSLEEHKYVTPPRNPTPTNTLQPESIANRVKKQSDNKTPVNVPKSSRLSEKDHDDLLHLLKQKNKLNNPLLQTRRGHGSSKELILDNNLSKLTSADLKISSTSAKVNETKEVMKTKVKITEVERNHSNFVRSKNQVSTTSKSVLGPGEDKKPQTDWEEVMNKLLAHKTPSRGPKALDLALNKYPKTCEKLRSLRIKKSLDNPSNSLDGSKTLSVGVKEVQLINKFEHSMPPNTGNNSVIKTNADFRRPELKLKQIKANEPISPDSCHNLHKNSIKTKLKSSDIVQHKPCNLQNNHLPKQSYQQESKRLPADTLKRQFTCALPKQDDPFISGLPNSDYDLLEELMDDELRKEIGELSDDDFNATANLSKDKQNELTNRTDGTVFVPKSVIVVPAKAECKCRNSNQMPDTLIDLSEQINSLTKSPPQQRKVNMPTQVPEKIKKKEILRADVVRNQSENIVNNTPEAENPVVTQANINIMNVPDPSVYVIPPPTLANVLLVSPNIYNTYSNVQTQLPVNDFTSELLLDQSNIPLYQSTQYVTTPLVSSVILGNTMSTPVLHEEKSPMTEPEKFESPINTLCESVIPVLNDNVVQCTVECHQSNVTVDIQRKSVLDFNLNKNVERKVLSPAQENHENGTSKTWKERFSLGNNLKSKELGNERLIKKRWSIINKGIYHGYNTEPIPLTYTPLRRVVNTTSEDKTDNNSSDSLAELQYKTEQTRNLIIANKIMEKSVPIAVEPNVNGRKTMVKLKPNNAEKSHEDISSENVTSTKVILTRKRASKRLNKPQDLACKNIVLTKNRLIKTNSADIKNNKPNAIIKDTVDLKGDSSIQHESNINMNENVSAIQNNLLENNKLKKKMPVKEIHIPDSANPIVKSNHDDHKKVDKIVIRKVDGNKHEITNTISKSLHDKEKSVIKQDSDKLIDHNLRKLCDQKTAEIANALKKIQHLLKPPEKKHTENSVLSKNFQMCPVKCDTVNITKYNNIKNNDESKLVSIKINNLEPNMLSQTINLVKGILIKDNVKAKALNCNHTVTDKQPSKDLNKSRKSTSNKRKRLQTKSKINSTKQSTQTSKMTQLEPTKSNYSNNESTEPPSEVDVTELNNEAANVEIVDALSKESNITMEKIKHSSNVCPSELKNAIEITHPTTLANECEKSKVPISSTEPSLNTDIESNKKIPVAITKQPDTNNERLEQHSENDILSMNTNQIKKIELIKQLNEKEILALRTNIPKNLQNKECKTKHSKSLNPTKETNIKIISDVCINSITSNKSPHTSKTEANQAIIFNNDCVDLTNMENSSIIVDSECENQNIYQKETKNMGLFSNTNQSIDPSDQNKDLFFQNPNEGTITGTNSNEKLSMTHKANVNNTNVIKIPDNLSDQIVIERLPNPVDDPTKQCVRVKLPNKKTFKATVHGKYVNVETLFADPAIKEILLKNLSRENKYTLSITQDAKIHGHRPIGTRKPESSIRNNSKNTIETVSLLSDDEDVESSRQSFTTEFGKYKVKSLNTQEFMKHQEKFNQKCIVQIKTTVQENISNSTHNPKVLVPSGLLSVNNYNNIMYAEKEFQNIVVPEVIEVDDSSNDSTICQKIEDISTLKHLLHKDLYSETILNSVPEENSIVDKSNKDDIIKSRECFVRLVNCDSLIQNIEHRGTFNKKYNAEPNCENENKISNLDHNLPDSNNDLNTNDKNSESNIVKEDIVAMSRSGSFSILNDFSLYEMEDSTETLENYDYLKRYTNSPVMEMYDVLASFWDQRLVHKSSKGSSATLCHSDLFETKYTLHKVHITLNQINNSYLTHSCVDEMEKPKQIEEDILLTHKNKLHNIPSLTTLVLLFLQSNDIIDNLRPRLEKTRKTKQSGLLRLRPALKRKLIMDGTYVINKLAKISLLPINKDDTSDRSMTHEDYKNDDLVMSSENLNTVASDVRVSNVSDDNKIETICEVHNDDVLVDYKLPNKTVEACISNDTSQCSASISDKLTVKNSLDSFSVSNLIELSLKELNKTAFNVTNTTDNDCNEVKFVPMNIMCSSVNSRDSIPIFGSISNETETSTEHLKNRISSEKEKSNENDNGIEINTSSLVQEVNISYEKSLSPSILGDCVLTVGSSPTKILHEDKPEKPEYLSYPEEINRVFVSQCASQLDEKVFNTDSNIKLKEDKIPAQNKVKNIVTNNYNESTHGSKEEFSEHSDECHIEDDVTESEKLTSTFITRHNNSCLDRKDINSSNNNVRDGCENNSLLILQDRSICDDLYNDKCINDFINADMSAPEAEKIINEIDRKQVWMQRSHDLSCHESCAIKDSEEKQNDLREKVISEGTISESHQSLTEGLSKYCISTQIQVERMEVQYENNHICTYKTISIDVNDIVQTTIQCKNDDLCFDRDENCSESDEVIKMLEIKTEQFANELSANTKDNPNIVNYSVHKNIEEEKVDDLIKSNIDSINCISNINETAVETSAIIVTDKDNVEQFQKVTSTVSNNINSNVQLNTADRDTMLMQTLTNNNDHEYACSVMDKCSDSVRETYQVAHRDTSKYDNSNDLCVNHFEDVNSDLNETQHTNENITSQIVKSIEVTGKVLVATERLSQDSIEIINDEIINTSGCESPIDLNKSVSSNEDNDLYRTVLETPERDDCSESIKSSEKSKNLKLIDNLHDNGIGENICTIKPNRKNCEPLKPVMISKVNSNSNSEEINIKSPKNDIEVHFFEFSEYSKGNMITDIVFETNSQKAPSNYEIVQEITEQKKKLVENAKPEDDTESNEASLNEIMLSTECELKGVEYIHPELGTCYVFRVVETIDKDGPTTITQTEEDEFISGVEIGNECSFEVVPPLVTYSKRTNEEKILLNQNKTCRRAIKRKSSSTDTRVEKRYRKGKNIDYPKFTAIAISESAFGKEYKRLMDYCSSIKFSYSRPFHKEYIDVEETLKNWPIKGSLNNNDVTDVEPNETLFLDMEDISRPGNVKEDHMLLTLTEDINVEYKYVTLSSDEANETNFSMGFGEGSDRVIQNLKDGSDISIFSAATLSDVKQNQPLLQPEEFDKNNNSPSRFDHIDNFKRYVSFINLKERVRNFFKNTTLDLNSNWKKENKKTATKNKNQLSNFPFDLTSTEFFERRQNDFTVNVVQIGQLPMSASAPNSVTCDPRVTQVSDASPPQCSAENTSSDDPQCTIKTEYTELTTADLSLPLQEYSHGDRIISSQTQEALNFQMNNESIPIETDIKPVVKIELEELPEVKEEPEETTNNESVIENQESSNVDYTFNGNHDTNSPVASNFQTIYNSTENQNVTEPYSQESPQKTLPEKCDQIAHAMNAAGISTTADTTENTKTQALVDMLAQKLRQGAINAGVPQTPTNAFTKSTITAMALQQALAQILPTSLNQSNPGNTQQTANASINQQMLHIVQGKNASGNQMTLVDNSQQSVISTPNSAPVLHIVQNKGAPAGITCTTTSTSQTNTFSGLSLVDGGIQQSGNQLLHIVNTNNQKNNNTGQLLKRVNLVTNLGNVQGSNEQKVVQFVCKAADGNAAHQRSMVLRLQPIETPNIQNSVETQYYSSDSNTPVDKEAATSQQEIKSRSVYEENYAKFIQNSSTKPVAAEKATSLPKFNQAFGKQVFQDGTPNNEMNGGSSHVPTASASSENSDCKQTDSVINLDHLSQINSPPLLLRKTPVPTSQTQPNLVQQIKQTIAPMNLQTMHGGVIYTRQIPVNIGGGQTINLITVPSTELIDDNTQKQQPEVKFVNQGETEQPLIKIVPQAQLMPNGEVTQDDNNSHLRISSDNAHTPQAQPVLTQMRIKLPMLSKTPQIVSGTRVVRPSFFQIQRNLIGGANQPVYQQLVLTAAPQLGQQTIRTTVPHAQTRNHIKVPNETSSSSESQMSSSTLEQLREFDLVLEQVKERSTVQPHSSPNTTLSKLNTSSKDTTDSSASVSSTSTESTQQVLYSIGNNQPMNMAYVNRKSTATTPTTSTFVRSPDSSGIVDSPSSSSHVPHTVTAESSSSETPSQPKPARVGSRSRSRPKSSSNPPNTLKLNTVPPKTSTQKPVEDEQTTQRILYILAEYKEQVENSPDKDKPAPRRRTNPPSTSSGSSKRKKSSSGSRRPSGCDSSPVNGDDACRTMGSEDSSCGTSQGDCNESCLEPHSPQDSPKKVVRKLNFEHETIHEPVIQPRPQPQRNVIVADGQTIAVARGTAGKPATAVLMPANYLLPVSMVKGGQQIAIVTNRGPKLLAVGGEGRTNALFLQRLIGPAGLKPVLARPGVRHVRLPAAALHNLQALNLTAASAAQPQTADSTASPAPAPTPPAATSPWTDRHASDVKPERTSSPDESEPWNIPSSAETHVHTTCDYSYENAVRAETMNRTVLDPIPDRYSPDMEAQRIFDKMFEVDPKRSYSPRCGFDPDASDCDDRGYLQVVQRRDLSHRQQRLSHVSAAALRHKYAILEHELRLQKSLSEECEDLGVDSPSAAELFPEAELLFTGSPALDHNQEHPVHLHTMQPSQLTQSSIPQPDMDDQIATDQLLPRVDEVQDRHDLNLGLEDVGIVTVSEDGMQATIALDQEEFARSHPNTTFHSEPTEEGEVQPFTISSIKGRHIASTIFHNRAPGTVLMATPQTTVISQATGASGGVQSTIKYSDIDNMINTIPGPHGTSLNLPSVLIRDNGLTKFDTILNDSKELHLSNTASTIVHAGANTTQVIRRVCYDDNRRDSRFVTDDPHALIAGDDAKMVAEDSSREAQESMTGDADDDRSSPDRHAELFWESNSTSERSESRRPLYYSSDSDKCCKSPSYEETNSTDSSYVGNNMRLDSVIKEARCIERSCSADGSSADDTHPPLRTYPPKRMYHVLDGMERSMSGKTRAGERSPDSLDLRRRASGRGVVRRGCHCCNGSPAPPRPKKPRQRKPGMDLPSNN